MNKVVKLGMIGAVILAALAVLALGIFIHTFDINNYKGAISRLVAEKTGRTLTFGGDISMTLFPRLGVRMDDISLSNAPGFGQTQMLSARQARLEVRILPLLSGRVRFGHLALDGVVVGLERDAAGRTNWGDLTDRAAGDAPAAERGGSVQRKGTRPGHRFPCVGDRRGERVGIDFELGRPPVRRLRDPGHPQPDHRDHRRGGALSRDGAMRGAQCEPGTGWDI